MFKSRNERVMALLLTYLDIKWEYEPVTYTLKTGELYVPDFWCEEIGYYIEVKGGHNPERMHKPAMLAEKLAYGDVARDGLRVALAWDSKLIDLGCRGIAHTASAPMCMSETFHWVKCTTCDRWSPFNKCGPLKCRRCHAEVNTREASRYFHDEIWHIMLRAWDVMEEVGSENSFAARWAASQRERRQALVDGAASAPDTIIVGRKAITRRRD